MTESIFFGSYFSLTNASDQVKSISMCYLVNFAHLRTAVMEHCIQLGHSAILVTS